MCLLKLQFELHISQIIFKYLHKNKFKDSWSIIAHILKIDENSKYFLGIIQTSIYTYYKTMIIICKTSPKNLKIWIKSFSGCISLT